MRKTEALVDTVSRLKAWRLTTSTDSFGALDVKPTGIFEVKDVVPMFSTSVKF
jgi:hypothetical protein